MYEYQRTNPYIPPLATELFLPFEKQTPNNKENHNMYIEIVYFVPFLRS